MSPRPPTKILTSFDRSTRLAPCCPRFPTSPPEPKGRRPVLLACWVEATEQERRSARRYLPASASSWSYLVAATARATFRWDRRALSCARPARFRCAGGRARRGVRLIERPLPSAATSETVSCIFFIDRCRGRTDISASNNFNQISPWRRTRWGTHGKRRPQLAPSVRPDCGAPRCRRSRHPRRPARRQNMAHGGPLRELGGWAGPPPPGLESASDRL